jgi:hypothetical protein
MKKLWLYGAMINMTHKQYEGQYEGQHADHHDCQNKKNIIEGQHIRLP